MKSTGTTLLSEAEHFLAGFVATKGRMLHEDGKSAPLDPLLIRYYENHASKLPSATDNFLALGRWEEFFGDVPLSELTPDRQQEFHAWLREKHGYKTNTINRIVSIGRAALKRAHKHQEVDWIPFIFDAKPVAGEVLDRDRVLQPEELAALIDQAPQRTPHVLTYFMLALNTMARPDAIYDLKLDQVSLKDGIINLNPKGRIQTKKFRPKVPITSTLRPWLEIVPTEGNPFVLSYAGRGIRTIHPTFTKMREKAGLDSEVIPYTLRHTMASVLRRKGVNYLNIPGMLGHAVPGLSTTERYAHYDPNYLSDAVSAIDEFMGEINGLLKNYDLTDPALRERAGKCYVACRDTEARRRKKAKAGLRVRVSEEGVPNREIPGREPIKFAMRQGMNAQKKGRFD